MGQLIYGAWRRRIAFDDRTLHHLRIALSRRMNRGTSFPLTWAPDDSGGRHAGSVMIHPGTPLEYRFDGPSTTETNARWLQALLRPTLQQAMIVTLEPTHSASDSLRSLDRGPSAGPSRQRE